MTRQHSGSTKQARLALHLPPLRVLIRSLCLVRLRRREKSRQVVRHRRSESPWIGRVKRDLADPRKVPPVGCEEMPRGRKVSHIGINDETSLEDRHNGAEFVFHAVFRSQGNPQAWRGDQRTDQVAKSGILDSKRSER